MIGTCLIIVDCITGSYGVIVSTVNSGYDTSLLFYNVFLILNLSLSISFRAAHRMSFEYIGSAVSEGSCCVSCGLQRDFGMVHFYTLPLMDMAARRMNEEVPSQPVYLVFIRLLARPAWCRW